MKDLLSAFDLGPAWARSGEPEKKYTDHPGERGGKDRGRGGRGQGGDGGRQRGDRRDVAKSDGRRGGGGGRFHRSDDEGRGRGAGDLPSPAEGVKVTVLPAEAAVHFLVKEIQHRARVYSLYDVAQLFLAERNRCRLEIRMDAQRPAMFRGRHDASLFLSKDEAVAHFMQSDGFGEMYETEEVETEPPKGNFQVVARCGISGEWLGPPNFHAYQTNLRRLHRERFASIPFERYLAKVRTERGEEAVNAWLETMKVRRRWRPKGGDEDSWTFDHAEIERDFRGRLFGDAFEEVRETVLPGEVPPPHVSERLMASIRLAGGHARRHPAMLIPTICRMLESDHLAIFKKQGKLFCGPARPHPLESFDELSERPAAITRWLDAHPDAKLGDMWKALLPEDTEEPPKEWLVDLFWLLTQGHVLLFADGTLVLPKRRHPGAGETAVGAKEPAGKEGKKRKKARKPKKKRATKDRLPKVPPHAGTVRKISRLRAGALRKLRGREQIWGRRLARRERIESLLE